MDALAQAGQLTWNREDRPLEKAEIVEGAKGVDCLVTMLTDTVDDEVLAANPQLRVVANYAVGFNNIDLAAATRRGIPVSNTPDVLTDATADTAWALLLAAARRVPEGDRYARSGEWTGWSPGLMLGADVSGATLGLIGLGRIGRAMIPRAQGFGMTLRYWSRTRLDEAEESRRGLRYGSFEEVLEESDFISLHVSLSEQTTHLIDAAALRRMKSSAILINTARGPVVDEKALVEALRGGEIAAAGLDVYEREPKLEPGLADLPNVALLPHVGSATIGTRVKMAEIVAANCRAAWRGEPLPNLVNTDLAPNG